LKDSNKPLWYGCINHSKLLVIAQVFTIKSNHGLSEASYDRIIEWMKSILPGGNMLKKNFYDDKSMMKPLDLVYQELTCVQTFVYYGTMKIQILPSVEYVGMLVINPKHLGKGLLSYIENWNTS